MSSPESTDAEITEVEIATPAPTGPTAATASKTGPRTSGKPLDRQPPGARLVTERGVTQISDVVVSKIAALATREIPGVYAMGKGLARAFGALRSRVPGGPSTDTSSQGIIVEVGERQAAIDINIVAHYGLSIIETTEAVRANVIDRLETMTGLEVVEVNINVDDLHFDSEPGSDDGPNRVL